jgi:deferrochelatase/peroxidase EfeB
MSQTDAADDRKRSGLTRRDLLIGAVAAGAGAGVDQLLAQPSANTMNAHSGEVVPFHGEHQAGIATAAQNYLSFAAFDLTSESFKDLRLILRTWSEAASVLTGGKAYLQPRSGASEPPTDPGDAVGLPPSRLTVTIGLGASVFTPSRRLGLSRLQPRQLERLPPFKGESLDASRSGGDLCVQACADDPQVAFHATHLLSRLAKDVATLRWTQLGFGRTSSTSRAQITPRNLMGFKDGTDNVRTEDLGAMRDHVWVQDGDGPAWMTGGTYLVARRIAILFDVWDSTSLAGQERTIGRQKLSGAPLGARGEYDPVDLSAVATDGEPTIPSNAHIRLASPRNNGGHASCVEATHSQNESSRVLASSTRASSSSPSSAILSASSCRSSSALLRAMHSIVTRYTPPVPCLPVRRAVDRRASSARLSSRSSGSSVQPCL